MRCILAGQTGGQTRVRLLQMLGLPPVKGGRGRLLCIWDSAREERPSVGFLEGLIKGTEERTPAASEKRQRRPNVGPCKFYYFLLRPSLWKFSLFWGFATDGPEGARGWGAVGSPGVDSVAWPDPGAMRVFGVVSLHLVAST